MTGFGSTVSSRAFWAFLNDDKHGGGALLDFGPYGAAWVRWFLGMPKTVYCITTHTRPDVYKTNTNATILCAFPDNAVGIIEGSWDLPRGFQELEVFGNLGSFDMTSSKIEAYVGRDRKEVPLLTLDEDHRDPATYFAKAVRAGKSVEDFVSAEFHMDVMEILEAAQRSAKSGQPVTLPLR